MQTPIRILLVDDSPYFLDVARDFLHMQEDFEVSGIAVDGRNALEQARQIQPDIILLDLNLGNQSGIQLIPLFKKHVPASKIIVLTIMDGVGYQLSAMQAGADAFVLKTHMIEELVARMFEVLGNQDVSPTQISTERFAEEVFSSNQQFLKDITDNSPALIYALDPGGRFLLINRELERVLGAPRETLLGKTREDILPLDIAAAHRLNDVRVMQDKQPMTSEEENHEIDGKHIYLSTKFPLIDGRGNIYGVGGISSDITARKSAESALEESERFNRETLNALKANIAILDKTGRIVAVNHSWREFAQLNGINPDQVSIGVDYLAVCDNSEGKDAEEAFAVAAGIRAVMSGTQNSFALEYPCHSPNEQRWFLVEVTKFDGAGPMRIVVAHENITGRKLVEQVLSKSEASLKKSEEVAHVGHWTWNTLTNVVTWSDEMKRIFGINPEDFSGNLDQIIQNAIHPDDRQRVLAMNDAVILNGKPKGTTYRIVQKNGSIRHVWAEPGESVKDERGAIIELSGIVQDITDREQAEEKIQRRMMELETLYESGVAFSRTLSPKAIGEKIVEMLDERLDWHHAAVRVRRAASREVDLLAFSHKAGQSDAGRILSAVTKVGQGMAGWVLEHGEPLRSLDLNNDPRYVVTYPGMQSGLYIPIKVYEQTIGCISVESDKENAFTDEDERLLFTLATQAAVGLENARLFQNLQEELNERKVTEAALAENEARYRSLIDQIPAIVYLDDLRVSPSSTQYVSPRVREFLGYTPAEWLAGGYGLWQKCIQPEDRAYVLNHYQASIQDGSAYSQEYRMVTRDERTIWVHDSATIQRDEQGKPLTMQGVVFDITETKRVESKLRLQSAALEAADNAMIITDHEGNILWINPAYTRLTGYEAAEVLGENPRILYSGMQAESFYRKLWNTILAGKVWHGELINKRKDGTFYHEEQTITPLLDSTGKVTHFIGIKQDITSRKQAEKDLETSEGKLRALFAAMQDVVLIIDREGIYREIAPTNPGLLYKPPEELLGKSVVDIFSAGEAELFMSAIQEVLATGKMKTMEYQLLVEGVVTWFSTNITPITEDATVWVAHDISSRKQAEQQISLQVERLTALRRVDQAIASTFDLQVSLNILASTTVKLLKADAAAILVLDHATNTLIYAAGTGFLTREVESARIRLGESYAGSAAREHRLVQIHNLEINGNAETLGYLKAEKFTSYYGVPLIVKGLVVGVLEVLHRSFTAHDDDWLSFFDTLAGQAAIAIDNAQLFSSSQRELAERKVAEERLRQSHAELEKRIEERTIDLRQVNVELERAVRVKDEFLANMSHELRTPLNAVIGLSDSLIEQTAGPLNEKQEKYVNTVRESGQHLLELINDILDLAKIEAGQVTLSKDAVGISAVCQASLRMIKQLALKKKQDVLFEMDADLETFRADERRIKQMIVNLLSNAVKFTPEKGKLGLRVSGDRAEGVVRFTVWDTGIGIQERDLARLFQPFVQLDSNLARKSGGTGLGLSLVAKMAGLHGGSVSVESQPDQGSRFTITLPWDSNLTTDALFATTGKYQITKPLATNQNYTILLVEDTDEVIMVVRDYLEYAGYKVKVARNGMDGVAQAEKMAPSLILMDVQMPVMDGLEATRRIRQFDALKDTPIIALTALAMKGDRERCLAAGMDDYISKPVNLRALIAIIENCLAPKRQQKH